MYLQFTYLLIDNVRVLNLQITFIYHINFVKINFYMLKSELTKFIFCKKYSIYVDGHKLNQPLISENKTTLEIV